MDSTELCRLCATEKDTFVDGFVRIYSDEGQKFGLQKKILRCLQIEVYAEDAYPKSVCLECCSKLHQCADFVESSTRAQIRLKILVESQLKALESQSTSAAQETSKEETIAAANTDSNPPQIIEDKDDLSSKYVECVIKDDLPQSESASKDEEELIPEAPRSRASKRKCRLPVRVSRVCLEDGIVDLENIDLDTDEISRIFADEDSEEETRRKRKGRKKRTAGKSKAKQRTCKAKAKKICEKNESDEHVYNFEENGKDRFHPSPVGESGSLHSDVENFENTGAGDDYDDDDDEDYTDEFPIAKPKSKSKPKEKKKTVEVDLTGYMWMCCDCPEEMEDVEALKLHHSSVHKTIPRYMCNMCSKVSTHYLGFLSHYRRHLDNDRYCTCETCGKCFSNKKALDSHRIIHTDKKPHVCNVCGKAFRQQSALYVHSRCHLPDELKNKFACDECDKRFSTKPNLVTHKRIHTGVRNFTCDQCGKSFVQKGNLDAHLLTHSTAKPFSCQLCDKSFKTELQLRKHGSVHTGVKPHQCDICGRQFRERGTLREHHRIHTGAMPFSCEFCGKTFRFKGVLTTHRRQHTGERPYSCVECQHHFTNWPNYNKHMKRRHGINTSRQARSLQPQTENSRDQTNTVNLPSTTPQPANLPTDSLQLPVQTNDHLQPEVALGPTSAPLAVCNTQIQSQPTALLHKTEIENHQPQHLYHHESALSQHSLHSQEDDSLSSHHEIYVTHSVHSPLPAHHPVSHAVHLAHQGLPTHVSMLEEDDQEPKYVSDREILLGQMPRERDRPHFYNPAPGSAINTSPYLHQSLHHSLQQSQIPMPGLYTISQLSLDPSHLEILHSSATQHR